MNEVSSSNASPGNPSDLNNVHCKCQFPAFFNVVDGKVCRKSPSVVAVSDCGDKKRDPGNFGGKLYCYANRSSEEQRQSDNSRKGHRDFYRSTSQEDRFESTSATVREDFNRLEISLEYICLRVRSRTINCHKTNDDPRATPANRSHSCRFRSIDDSTEEEISEKEHRAPCHHARTRYSTKRHRNVETCIEMNQCRTNYSRKKRTLSSVVTESRLDWRQHGLEVSVSKSTIRSRVSEKFAERACLRNEPDSDVLQWACSEEAEVSVELVTWRCGVDHKSRTDRSGKC